MRWLVLVWFWRQKKDDKTVFATTSILFEALSDGRGCANGLSEVALRQLRWSYLSQSRLLASKATDYIAQIRETRFV